MDSIDIIHTFYVSNTIGIRKHSNMDSIAIIHTVYTSYTIGIREHSNIDSIAIIQTVYTSNTIDIRENSNMDSYHTHSLHVVYNRHSRTLQHGYLSYTQFTRRIQ